MLGVCLCLAAACLSLWLLGCNIAWWCCLVQHPYQLHLMSMSLQVPLKATHPLALSLRAGVATVDLDSRTQHCLLGALCVRQASFENILAGVGSVSVPCCCMPELVVLLR